jgi:hypothetical protein
MSRDFSFIWESSKYTGDDTLRYCLEFFYNNDTICQFDVSDTILSFIPSELLEIMDTSAIMDIKWTVRVSDNNSIVCANEKRNLTLVNVNTVSIDNDNIFPSQFVLHQNFPNPFNPITQIDYEIPIESHVQIAIYDLKGNQIKILKNERQIPGFYSTIWNAKTPSGIYFYKIQTKDFVEVKKCILMK